MKEYKRILKKIIKDGYVLPPAERQGIGTRQITSTSFRHDLRTGFPLLTTKKMFTRGFMEELFWMLRGDNNIKPLVDTGVNIWNEDAFNYAVRLGWRIADYRANDEQVFVTPDVKNPAHMIMFLHAVKERHSIDGDLNIFGDIGPGYGPQMRDYNGSGLDQIKNMVGDIKSAIKNNHNNRRMIVLMWNPLQIKNVALPWCHKDFQVILEPRETGYYINLIWNQRSVDTFLGLPFNIAYYAMLTHILGALTDTTPKDLVGELRCVHLYDNHIQQAHMQLERDPKSLPTLWFDDTFKWNLAAYQSGQIELDQFIKKLHHADFHFDNYDPHPPIKANMVS